LSRMIISEQLVDNSAVEIDAINGQLTFATRNRRIQEACGEGCCL
jgi:hypothetical protein